MADKQPAKPKAKRLVKNPETFRERAVKASEDDDKPKRTDRAKRAGSAVAKPARKPLGAIGRKIIPAYIRNSWQELRKVTWPTWNQSRRLTVAVLIFATVFGVLIAAVDFALDRIFRDILFK
jgi:preprotein translocase subunit SecE